MRETLFDKIWAAHVVATRPDGATVLHIDRHMIHELTSPQAFERLRAAGRRVRNAELTFATQDHIVATSPGRSDATWADGAPYVQALRRNVAHAGITLFDLGDPRQGIVHVVTPELAIALPGTTLVCGDSHTCTVGGLGALAFGIGTSEVEHVLATQTLIMHKPKRLRIKVDGRLGFGVTAKDLILAIIAQIGAGGGTGHAVEYAGSTISALSVEERLTVCNMSIELGSRIGMIAPDDTVFSYLAGRPYAPKGADWDRAVAAWRALRSDDDAVFDREVAIDAASVAPQVTWGTSPQDTLAIDGKVPEPDLLGGERAAAVRRALSYMDLEPGVALEGLPIQKVFIGSCTNSRLSDLRAAAAVAKGGHVAQGVRALVVPGSTAVKQAAEAEGLDRIFTAAGFEWREAGCSMCCAVNGDIVAPGERCVSTSNRNFEGRQGLQARTHLASPATAAAAALTGHITDVRKLALERLAG
jgi:3-isopropylmalate/(R)-2-methylmalate dehydratase large subunit